MNYAPSRIVLFFSFLLFGMLTKASNALQEYPDQKLLVISMDIPQLSCSVNRTKGLIA